MADHGTDELSDPRDRDPLGTVLALRNGDDEPDRPRSRRALWISLAAIVALSALSVPIARHFVNHTSAAPHTPAHVAGLTLDTASDATSTAEYLRSAIAAGMNLTTSVGAVYTNGQNNAAADAHSVIFVGGNTKGSDSSLVTQIMSYMDDNTDGITGEVAENAGGSGTMTCGLTTDTTEQDSGTATEMSVCAYADGGRVGIALFPNRTVSQAATLMREFKSAIE